MPDVIVNGQEVMGSRREWEDGQMMYGQRLFVYASGAHGLTKTTPIYYTPKSGSADNGSNNGTSGRILTTLRLKPEEFPGVILYTLTYVGFRTYA